MTPLARIRQWWQERRASPGPHDLVVLRQQCVAELETDQDLLLALGRRALAQQVARIGEQVMRAGNGYYRVGGRLMTHEQLVAEIAQDRPAWERWVLRRDGHELRLLEMRRSDLLQLAQTCRRQGEHAIKHAVFLETIASAHDLADDRVTVGEVFRPQSLARLYEAIEVRLNEQKILHERMLRAINERSA